MYKIMAALMVVLCLCSGFAVYGQGLQTTANSKDWEEINFEFNSSVLVDGYPSLLRLSELLKQHPEYKVRLEGHADWIGNDQFNDKLALARAETVKSFLVKYGAGPGQVETTSRGKRVPEVSNSSPEGRFMNRRVALIVSDAQGKVVSEGGAGEAIKALEDCCDAVLQKLNKLDDILAALKNLKDEDLDRLKQDLAAMKQAQADAQKRLDEARQAQQQLEKQVASIPPPPKAEDVAKAVRDTLPKAPPKFAILGINLGLDMTGNLTAAGSARYFAPFGETFALQAGGEYLHYHGRQEGQFDLGLVNRYKNFQAGLFSSLKRVSLNEFSAGGTLGQASVSMDYLFSRGRIGMYGTKSYLDEPILSRTMLAPTGNVWLESYLHLIDQVGGSAQVGLWKNAYVEGSIGALFLRGGSNRPGGAVKFVQPLNQHWAFTVEGGLNETLVGKDDSGRVAIGIQFGNWVRPKDFVALKHPVPMDVQRIRYELLTRTVRTGNAPPVADAGPDQIDITAGIVTLDGSGSFDPDNDPITYEWRQIAGPAVSISGVSTSTATFTAAEGQAYSFRLTVKDSQGAIGTDTVTVIAKSVPLPAIVNFAVTPASITTGQSATLLWQVQGAATISITPDIGNVAASGSKAVSPAVTTTFVLTASNAKGQVTQSVTLTVTPAPLLSPLISNFAANPVSIQIGQSALLSWQTQNATSVSIDNGVGVVAANGSTSVSPRATTVFTLTATGNGKTTTATVTIAVTPVPPAPAARITSFVATPGNIKTGESAVLVWSTENADSVTLSSIGSVAENGTLTVTPTQTTNYVLTAKNAASEVTATVTITVNGPPTLLPAITSFGANPISIASGQSSTLAWTVENADSVTISGIGSVNAKAGTASVSPAVTTTYILTATGNGKTITATVTVAVTPLPPPLLPAITSFSANPTSITSGQFSTLAWTVENAETVTISGVGSVNTKAGTVSVSPIVTTTFILTATGNGQTVTQSVTVTVGPPASQVKILNFTATPGSTAKPGDPVTLRWVTQNATQSVITGVGSVAVNDSVTVNPTADTIYTLIVYGPGGSVEAAVLVKVGSSNGGGTLLNNPPIANAGTDQTVGGSGLPFVTLDASGSSDPDGDPITYSWRLVSPWLFCGFDNSESVRPIVTLGLYGDYTFELTVRDSKGAVATSLVHVKFTPPPS